MTLLQPSSAAGYPIESLLGRIGGRRGFRITKWEPLLAPPDQLIPVPAAPWRRPEAGMAEDSRRGLLREIAWVYRQMEPGARKMFAPVFSWFEIRTLLICLRSCGAGNGSTVTAFFAHSLLSEQIKKVLRQEETTGAACRGVAKCLAARSPKFVSLERAYAGHGLGGFEQRLTDLYLELAAAESLHPVIAGFVSALIDLRNVMTLYKHLRWRIRVSPVFLGGGSLGRGTLLTVQEEGDPAGVIRLAARLTGQEPASTAALERELLHRITRLVRRWRVTTPGPGTILDYLWMCQLEARNLGIISQGAGLDRDTLREELIP
jgi:ATP synthase (C/AC39) subunit